MFNKLETPISLGRKSQDSGHWAVRLSPERLSTDKSIWVTGNKQNITNPLEIFPSEEGALRYIFPDTVVVEVQTPLAYFEKEGKIVGNPTPTDPIALSPLIQNLFGVKGDYQTARVMGQGWGYQQYRISTCNIPLRSVYAICQELIQGKHKYLGNAIRFVRLDITTNIPGAIAPDIQGHPDLLADGWEYKDNGHLVGDCCHTYVISRTETGSIAVESKIYDKFRYMLEVGAVAKTIGDNLANILDSNQDNIRKAFYSKEFQDNGFGRVETRFFDTLGTLESIVATHVDCCHSLTYAHSQSTSFQDSWNTFLQPGHTQTAVVVENLDKGIVDWTITRWVNRKTDKANGYSGTGWESLNHNLAHRTMGQYPVNIYLLQVHNGDVSIVADAVLLPDTLHTAMLVDIGEGKTSKAAVVSQKLSWEAVGLSLPFSLANKCTKGRHAKLRGNADTSSIDEGTLDSAKSREAKAKKVEAMQAKREKEFLAKMVAKAEAESKQLAPINWKSHKHISELAEVAKPICTRYYMATELKYPCYLVKVGTKWYKANTSLSRQLDKQPKAPFAIEVWDSGKEYNKAKVWTTNIKPLA